MRHSLGLLLVLITTSAMLAEHQSIHSQFGFFIAVGYARLQSPDEAYIYGITNLPPQSVLRVACSDFIGQGSHIVGEDARVVVAPNGLFRVSLPSKQPYEFKNNMICSVVFGAEDQTASVQKITGRHGENLGDPRINSQVLTSSGGHYLEAETVLHS
jgi:hypothetical protein